MLNFIIADLTTTKQPERVSLLQHFFQTHKWWYGEWDIFLWHRVPDLRKIAKKYYKVLNLNEMQKLIESQYHEFRLISLMMLVYKIQSKKITELEKKEIYEFYIENTKYINNWDLVDLSAPGIVWNYLFEQKDKKNLYKLAKSRNMRERRIAIVSTYFFIKKNNFILTLDIAKLLLDYEHHLIHKAVWRMLREMWKKDTQKLEDFLEEFASKMPRTMLRYAIEKFPEGERKEWLRRKIKKIPQK